jgi:predicted nucleic acid-binding protein
VVDTPLTFVDTNVLAYAHDRSETVKQPIAQALLGVLWRDRAGVLSTQVLQALYLVLAASELEERHTLSFWDALVLEAARLVSEDLQPGRGIGGVLIENPFA